MTNNFDIRVWFKNREEPLIIAGPCSVESREQLLQTAELLSKNAQIKVLRGGIWKPRTQPGAFEGVGCKGLPWMAEAKTLTGMLTTTEVATPAHCEAALKSGIDILWIGARTVVNPFSIQELAECLRGTDIPVFVKNPLVPDLKLWIGAIERLQKVGLTYIGAIHRGFHSYSDSVYRNAPFWELPIELSRCLDLPLITDISHMCGCRNLLKETAQKALDLASDGLMVESHFNPEAALTDATQQLKPTDLNNLLDQLIIRSKKTNNTECDLHLLRAEIDKIDDALLHDLARRMQVSQQIGEYKKSNNITVVQMDRWKQIISNRIAEGCSLNLDSDFVREIFDTIHQASIKSQTKIFENKDSEHNP